MLQLQFGALWHLVACTNPVGSKSTFHLLYSVRGLRVQKLNPSVTSTRLRQSFQQFVFAPGPTSSAVLSGYTSSTTMALWLALSRVAQRTAHQALLLTSPGRRFLPCVVGHGSNVCHQSATSSMACLEKTFPPRRTTIGYVIRRSCLSLC